MAEDGLLRTAPTDDGLVGTTECPICGDCTPHYHPPALREPPLVAAPLNFHGSGWYVYWETRWQQRCGWHDRYPMTEWAAREQVRWLNERETGHVDYRTVFEARYVPDLTALGGCARWLLPT